MAILVDKCEFGNKNLEWIGFVIDENSTVTMKKSSES